MNILLCCEHFYPSVGGVQKMMHEIGRRFVNMGHTVSVATSWRADRHISSIDGIQIVSFKAGGNEVLGLSGEIESYQQFLVTGSFDLLLVMAAQQWTFDAMLPVLDKIPYQKFHIPCGYSCFFWPKFKTYYAHMADHLKKFDRLIYNSTHYRDIDYARAHHVPHLHIIPAGASEYEFQTAPVPFVKNELGIRPDEFVYLSVGAPAYNKGHREVIRAYQRLQLPFSSCLILNGNYSEQNHGRSWRSMLKAIAMDVLGRSPRSIMKEAKKNRDPNKRILFVELERDKLISLFFEADLFLFASHVEYSPLVIFECLAAGLPFVSPPVGNVDEIIEWSGGGRLCKAHQTSTGDTRVDENDFVRIIEQLSLDSAKRRECAQKGRESWVQRFNWKVIAEKILELVG